ncbi:MAG: cytochrome c [Ignavibacteriae bacterium]|nr:cytochrome c [Ignavibacteriota bacterium]MCB9242741.1 cytochrome c [Ignavibacteriales bacterium]
MKTTIQNKFIMVGFLGMLLLLLLFTSCSQRDPEIGIGPVDKVEISATIDDGMVTKGKQIFETKCLSCHKINEKFVGPALIGVTKRRKPEWIMNQILNPEEMTKKDEVAKRLFHEYNMTQMTFQNVTQDDARAILEYFRKNDSEK